MKTKHFIVSFLVVLCHFSALQAAPQRSRYNFNHDWLLYIGDQAEAKQIKFNDSQWKAVNLPAAFNEDQAFAKDIKDLDNQVVWYRKHFKVPATHKKQKIFIEFEGARQGAEIWINEQFVGQNENGVMAFGFDITDYLNFGGKENIIALRIDNSWDYKEKESGTAYQWNDRNFNANYGGLPKNVILHCTDKLYQTLPLMSSLGTQGVYTYADQMDVREKTAVMHVASEVRNENDKPVTFYMNVVLRDNNRNMVREFRSEEMTLPAGETGIVSASAPISKVKFWSWGYGALYHVSSSLVVKGKACDIVETTTGIRKTEFRNGMFYLNGRVLQLKGYAQRSSNEWPAVGSAVAPWLSDFSNGLMERGNANFVRWMHVTPWKQDIESCDRVGLIQALPAGDSEKDAEGRQWEQRLELMRDAIVYNRNNPSVIFYECGNENISEAHMAEMKALRDMYDPYGGRAIGSREMLGSKVAEYGGEMLYINKSANKPVFAHEYNRNEGLRKYWDNYSYPYHKDGDGPLYKGEPAPDYNMNMDSYVLETVRRWYDYWECRPGTGRRVSSGGANIIFSDTNTHHRGESNYRTSGEVDAMRIPKDAFFAHQVMWGGWVNIENKYYQQHIVGHWNYEPGTVKDVFVVSNAERVELFINGISQGFGQRSYQFLFTFKDIKFQPGNITAIGYDARGREVGEHAVLATSGAAQRIRLSVSHAPNGFHADGADMALVDVEVLDAQGRRCPLANNMIHFETQGPVDFRGGIAHGREDNYVLSKDLPVECGINRVLLRATREAGPITLIATAEGLSSDTLRLTSQAIEVKDGLSEYFPQDKLIAPLWRGATPGTPSFTLSRIPVSIRKSIAGYQSEKAAASYDDNEETLWKNDGKVQTAWIEFQPSRQVALKECCLKLSDWRKKTYRLRISGYCPTESGVEEVILWEGETEKSLGYITLPLAESAPVGKIRIEALSDNGKASLSIVEAEFYARQLGH
ncbi:MAG: DUF4982 domain-containing protein [Bacteroidales bacterium]|nr:DUF4982 domain-containing protein [Bacteroidales bacterium]